MVDACMVDTQPHVCIWDVPYKVWRMDHRTFHIPHHGVTKCNPNPVGDRPVLAGDKGGPHGGTAQMARPLYVDDV